MVASQIDRSPDPRESLEAEESRLVTDAERAIEQQTAFALGRVLIWLLSSRKVDLPLIGLRAYVIAYCVRPDLINGMTLEEISHLKGVNKQYVHKLTQDFMQTFGVRRLGQWTDKARENRRRAWYATNPDARAKVDRTSHLWLVSKLSNWIRSGRHKSMSSEEITNDFKPVIVFLQSINKY